jgi:hypothetical protein
LYRDNVSLRHHNQLRHSTRPLHWHATTAHRSNIVDRIAATNCIPWNVRRT